MPLPINKRGHTASGQEASKTKVQRLSILLQKSSQTKLVLPHYTAECRIDAAEEVDKEKAAVALTA
ncbi:hypothetical protein EAE99_006289 [Botrytis elliptica]|nr:hypothetical protein EAE99_006289 [Botrytis elliptica]